MKKILSVILVIIVIAVGGYFWFAKGKNSSTNKNTITISAAASLNDPLNKAKEVYEASHKDVKLDINFAASSTLENQIEQGAPVDIFVSASPKYTDQLIDKKVISKDDVSNYLTNKLVLARYANAKDKITSIDGLKNSTGKIALGDKAVPVGLYAQEALKNMGIFDDISSRIIYSKDAIAALNYLEKGEVDYAVIYENELIGAKNVVKVADFPADSHKPVIYTLATLNKNKGTTDFKNFLESKEGKEIFKEYGFEVN